MSNEDGEYPIGYGRPPKHTQFQKGASGNPRGRKKKKSKLESVRKILNEKMPVTIDGQDATITPVEAAARKAIKQGLSGNLRDLRAMIAFFNDIGVEMFTEDDKRNLDGQVQHRALEQLEKLRTEIRETDKFIDLMEPYRAKHKAMILGDPEIFERQIEFWTVFLEDAPNEVAYKKRLEALKVEKRQPLMSEKLIKKITSRYRERNGKAFKYRK